VFYKKSTLPMIIAQAVDHEEHRIAVVKDTTNTGLN
jgi:hypothetical protein